MKCTFCGEENEIVAADGVSVACTHCVKAWKDGYKNGFSDGHYKGHESGYEEGAHDERIKQEAFK